MTNTSEDFKKLEHVLAELKPDERVLVGYTPVDDCTEVSACIRWLIYGG